MDHRCPAPRIPRARTARIARTLRPAPALPPAPPGHTPHISATPETLPRGQAARPLVIPDAHGPGLHHYVMYLDLDQIQDDVALLEYSYRELRGPIRPHVWRMLCVPDPDLDPVGYLESRWWDHATIADLALIRYMEALGLLWPFPHGRTRGPLLSPSRA